MMEGRKTTARERVREARDSRGVVARPLYVSVILRSALCAFLVFATICQPYTISASGWQIEVQKQEANATPAVIPAALAFLEEAAAVAGLTVSDFVTMEAIFIGAGTGFCILDASAEWAGDSTVDALHKIINTAEWPSYEGMSDSEKQEWGSEANYKAAQLNSYLDVFGLGEARDNYYSGGGDFDEESKGILQRLGDVAGKWSQGLKIPTVELRDLMPDIGSTDFTAQLIDQRLEQAIESEVQWPPSVASPVIVNGGYYFYANDYKYSISASGYINALFWGANGTDMRVLCFSDTPFTTLVTNGNSTSSRDSLERTVNGKTFYIRSMVYGNHNNWLDNSTVAFTGTYHSISDNELNNLAYKLLYENNVRANLEGWPGGLPEDVVYPDEGVGAESFGPDTNWNDLFGKASQPITRPETPFNPDNQSGSGIFDQQAQAVFIPLIQLPFDKMFPFCVIWDIGKLMDKMYELGGVGSVSADQSTSLRSVYAQRDGLQVQGDRGDVDLSIPGKPEWTQGHTEIVADLSQFGIPGTEGMTLMVDVWPLAVLLSYIRPFLQMLFIAGLLYVTILTFRMFIFNG